jgi:hypothetical protein
MLSKKIRAVTSRKVTTPKNIQQRELYRSSRLKSNGNLEDIGDLLLTLIGTDLTKKQKLSSWLLLEQKLRLYYSEVGL